MTKKRLSFYTNIPTPYQIDFFTALSDYFELSVTYYAEIQNDRQWTLSQSTSLYKVRFLKNNWLAKTFQKFMLDFHFSNSIFKIAGKEKSAFVILGGNYFIPNTIIALIVLKLRGKKVFWFGERLLPNNSAFKLFLKKLLLLPLRMGCDGILAIGNTAVESYAKYGFKQPKFNIHYNINNTNFLPRAIHNNSPDESNRQIILTSGSLIARKGMDIAIKAFQGLSPALKKNKQLWIIGDGGLREELTILAAGDNDIVFMGFKEKNEVAATFKQASFFLFCSRYDGWGLVVNEALAAGLPVVVSNTTGASELIENSVNGFVVNSQDPGKYTEALEHLMRLPGKSMSGMREANLAKAGLIDSGSMARKLLGIVERCS